MPNDWAFKTQRKTPAQVVADALELADQISGCNLPDGPKQEFQNFLKFVVVKMQRGMER